MKKTEERPLTRREKREIIEAERQNLASSFNRGRTISGLKKEKSERMERRKLIVRRRKIGGFFAFLCFVAFLSIAILTQLVVKIEISVNGKVLSGSESQKYINSIEEYYSRQPIERLRSYLKKDDLLSQIQKSTPEVQDISKIYIAGLGKYSFDIKMRQPVAFWLASGKKMYVDSRGVSFEKNYHKEPSLEIKDEGVTSVSSGKVVASNGFISFVGQIVSILAGKNLKVSKVVISPTSLRQVDVYIEGVAFPVKMLITTSPEGQANNLVSAIGYFSRSNIKPQYLDLRVEGKGYYK